MTKIFPRAVCCVLTWLALALVRMALCSGPGRVPAIAHYFGTKARYEELHPRLLLDALSVNRSLLQPLARCTPLHITAVIRHGTRFPTVKNILRMQKLYQLVVREATGTTAWLKDIQTNWDMWYTEDMDGQLVEKGGVDLVNLARRLSVLFPTLLSEENLAQGRIRLLTSSKHRCVSSIQAFQDGLAQQGAAAGEGVQYRHEVNDQLMRFFEHCHGYVEGVERNRTALAEVEKFKEGREMARVTRRVAERLGLPHHRLTPELVEAAFFLCSYEFSIKSLHSPWCSLFDEDDAKVLEYKSDLKQYWKRGHGHVITGRSSCPLFHNIFSGLEEAARAHRSGEPLSEVASIQLGHAETLLPLLTLLGLYKDLDPPTAHNYHTQHGRSFRSGRIVPYAANLVLVLYGCQDGPSPRLQLLLNEAPLRLSGLDEDVPPYQAVRHAYRNLLNGCDSHNECERKPSYARPTNTEL